MQKELNTENHLTSNLQQVTSNLNQLPHIYKV
jgi:hypothetical protein